MKEWNCLHNQLSILQRIELMALRLYQFSGSGVLTAVWPVHNECSLAGLEIKKN